MSKKKKMSQEALVTQITYDFTIPHPYYISSFGLNENRVTMYVLNLTVGQLLQDFKIFEELNNVQSWPICTLIQRELDHKRASLICRDYLLASGNTKYFPPLIAVLIPTDEKYRPLDFFPKSNSDEIKSIETKFIKGVDSYNDYEKPQVITGGITNIPFDVNRGDLIWDKKAVSAVIIDGQHRYKALEEAKNNDKNYEKCLITVTLVDLPSICQISKKPPTDVARDLFVTINNTPVEVDETRLVLMDDNDVLSTFTQVLIDDSNGDEPAIPPELIDWVCDGGKHNLDNSLSGVLVLRQIILSAIFKEAKISTVDDRTNFKAVRRWKDQIESWLAPDELIKNKLGSGFTISNRFKVAEAEVKDNKDDEDEESLFLFSYSKAVSKILKARFKELYLNSFRCVFSKLFPFKDFYDIAVKHDVLKTDCEINKYYRAFKGRRAQLKGKNDDIKKAVAQYEKDCGTQTEKIIPYAVMGQKAIFVSLFDGFLSTANDMTNEEYLKLTEEYVLKFNEAYSKLSPSKNRDENFFHIEYKLKGESIKAAKSIGQNFWKGIIIKFNNEIDYSRTAVLILSQIIQDILLYEPNQDDKIFKFKEHDKLVSRHMRMFKKQENPDVQSDEKLLELAKNVVKSKENELNNLLNAIKQKQKKTK